MVRGGKRRENQEGRKEEKFDGFHGVLGRWDGLGRLERKWEWENGNGRSSLEWRDVGQVGRVGIDEWMDG
jgi:hypothetical protein